MKTKLILLALVAFSFKSFSQTKNAIYFQYGTSTDKLSTPKEYYTGGGFGGGDNRGLGGNMIGLKYVYTLNRWLSLSSGISYSKDRFHFAGVLPGHDYETIKLISVPATLNFNFLKYLFVDAGITADFQQQKTIQAASQTGVGIELGGGAKYNFGPVGLFVNPYFQERSGKDRLISRGFKFGAGYCF